MKKIIFLFVIALLAACSASPNLVHSKDPILNIESALYPYVDVSLHRESATVRNTSNYELPINYLVTWYDKNGVTQLQDGISDEKFSLLTLQAKEKTTLTFIRPTEESINYRLYMAPK